MYVLALWFGCSLILEAPFWTWNFASYVWTRYRCSCKFHAWTINPLVYKFYIFVPLAVYEGFLTIWCHSLFGGVPHFIANKTLEESFSSELLTLACYCNYCLFLMKQILGSGDCGLGSLLVLAYKCSFISSILDS